MLVKKQQVTSFYRSRPSTVDFEQRCHGVRLIEFRNTIHRLHVGIWHEGGGVNIYCPEVTQLSFVCIIFFPQFIDRFNTIECVLVDAIFPFSFKMQSYLLPYADMF